MKRDWSMLRAKCDEEGRCRLCHRSHPQAAHIIARAHTRPGLDAGEHPDNCVPLCDGCHRIYDARELDILPLLTAAEQAKAVELTGNLITALERITGAKWLPVTTQGGNA